MRKALLRMLKGKTTISVEGKMTYHLEQNALMSHVQNT